MKKLLLSIIAAAGITSLANAQYVDQALLFSQQNYGSTARSKAMGNAFGAVGGDFSSLSINPAGIGIYLKSEVSGSLDLLGIKNTESTYQNQLTNDRNTHFGFRNFGYVMAGPANSANSGLVTFNFGIGFNKLNNFNQDFSASKNGSLHSRLDAFAENANGITSSQFFKENDPYNSGVPWESKLAWENYLINVKNPDQNGVGNQYESFLFANETVNQNYSVSREGFLNEYVIALGANFNHNLYLGATIGLQDLYYNESSTYMEKSTNSGSNDWGWYEYNNFARTRGFGYNFKFGMIYRPTPSLRLGAAIHTPTFFDLSETYSSTMSSTLMNISADANGTHREETPVGDYSYKMDSPMRAIGSVAYQFGKKGMLSFDYEFVDYSKIKLRNGRDGYNWSTENTDIKTIYQSVANLRFGGEYRLTDMVSLRGGYELFGNPYKTVAYGAEQPNKDYNKYTLNAGLGYRVGNVSFDLAYSYGSLTHYSYIYQLNQTVVDPVKYKFNNNEIVFTVAIKL